VYNRNVPVGRVSDRVRIVFATGEGIHRRREAGCEPLCSLFERLRLPLEEVKLLVASSSTSFPLSADMEINVCKEASKMKIPIRSLRSVFRPNKANMHQPGAILMRVGY
jgi:hypothetical protein